MPDPALARMFLTIGADYDRYRPGFPAEAADLAVAEVTGGSSDRVDDVLDLGAGTGKFTELLVTRAGHVRAVDPSEQMLAELRRKLPGVDAGIGTAEHLPLSDSSVDLVVVAQAFHWFDREPACREIARVLRDGGVLAVVWNVSGLECAWDRACGAVAHLLDENPDADADEAGFGRHLEDGADDMEAPEAPGFVLVRSERLSWTEPISREHYLRRWMTVSTMLAATDDQREEALARMADILDADPETAGLDVLSLANVTEVFLLRAA
ncbi:class I SAM-dependent methyltransferase [Humibacter ginsenosidimutans]|uniref:Class I SAM-dependent methyltransferase n=1 Tax=Humibacter ginsenosidimutans TaxID=2599293 RepID=A0A5B8M4V4_9MICO|nr:class I SAM-dependent methyltransferase [Humibacter ginsenosidimutans]QDZ15251.1 class I SAM-dependent methyltransferase [Humibacter ginsenosidimutans]